MISERLPLLALVLVFSLLSTPQRGLSAEDPKAAPAEEHINLEPPRRDMARMGLERKFFEDLQKEVEYDYDAIKEKIPGITYSTWRVLTQKALNACYRLKEYKKAMVVYQAALRRGAVIGTFTSYTILPAMIAAITKNPALTGALAMIPWEIPFVPLWIKFEVALQKNWLRWQLWGPNPGDWKLNELEDLRRQILEVDPDNRIFTAVYEAMESESKNYAFNVVKNLKDEGGNDIAFNSVTVEELENIVRYAKDGPKFLVELRAKRGPYPLYSALLLRIIDQDDFARSLLKSLLAARIPDAKAHPYKPQFTRLETLRAELNTVSGDIINRLLLSKKAIPAASRPEGYANLIHEEMVATQRVFRHIMLLEHRFLLQIHAGENPNMNPILSEIRDVLKYQKDFLAELDLPYDNAREHIQFAEKVLAWKRKHPGPAMEGMDCSSPLRKFVGGVIDNYSSVPAGVY